MEMMRSAVDAGSNRTRRPGAPDGTLPAELGAVAGGIGGIIFEIDDVLYDATLWRRWLLRLVARLGVQADYASFYRSWDRDYLVDVNCGRREFTEAFQSFLLAAGLSWAQIDEIEAASRIQRQNFELNVRPLPGVVKTIAQLNELRLPLLAFADSPCTADRLAERLERLGLGGQFQTILSSFDLEVAQPVAQCYQSALGALGLPADQVTYVGHDAEHLQGAKAAGLRTVAFNFGCHAHADFYLTRFEDLLPLVKSWPVIAPPVGAPPGVPFGGRNESVFFSQGNCG
jgi:FMN phosphatase YigB (HAD superfamily)